MMLTFTKEQLEERRKYITATNVPVIFGVSPWGSEIDLYLQKRGELIERAIPDALAEKGLFLEPAIRRWFTYKTGIKILEDETLHKHPKIDYLAAHTDGITTCKKAVFEAKTAMRSKGWGEQGENVIPDHYLLQVAHEVACADAERAHIAVLIAGNDFRYYTYDRNLRLEAVINERLAKFWDCVKKGEMPKPRTGNDIISIYGNKTTTDLKFCDADLQKSIDELHELKAVIKDHEERQKKIEDQIKVFMGTSEILKSPDGSLSATWKCSKDSVQFDKDLFMKENPEEYKKYLTKKVKGSRRFLLK